MENLCCRQQENVLMSPCNLANIFVRF